MPCSPRTCIIALLITAHTGVGALDVDGLPWSAHSGAPSRVPMDIHGKFVGSWAGWMNTYLTISQQYRVCTTAGGAYYEVVGQIIGPNPHVPCGITIDCSTAIDSAHDFAVGACLSADENRIAAEASSFVKTAMKTDSFRISFTTPLLHWQDLNVDWVVLGFRKCGTTSLVYNLGLHPELTLRATHKKVLEHAIMTQSKRYLPPAALVKQLRFGANQTISEHSNLEGHPDLMKNFPSSKRRLIGFKLSSPMAELEGADLASDRLANHSLGIFWRYVLASAKPKLKLFFVVRDPIDCLPSNIAWTVKHSNVTNMLLVCATHPQRGICPDLLSTCLQTAPVVSFCKLVACHGRLRLFHSSQTTDKVALEAAARFIGASAEGYPTREIASISARNDNNLIRSTLDICSSRFGRARRLLAHYYRDDYVALPQLLEHFGIAPLPALILARMAGRRCP